MKSTSCWALASFLSRHHSVLVIDLDPAATLSAALAGDARLTIYDVLTRGDPIVEAITPAVASFGPNLQIITACGALSGLDAATSSRVDRQYMVADALAAIRDYDFVLMDTPAGQSILSTAAMTAADFCISPCASDDASYQQLPAFKRLVEVIQHRIAPAMVWLPIVAAFFDQRQSMDKIVLSDMRKHFRVFDPPIPKRVSVREEMAAQRPCTLPDFHTLTQNILEEINRHEKEVRAPPSEK